MVWAEDLSLKKKRIGSGIKGEKLELEWGSWMRFKHNDKIDIPSLAFFSDMMSSIPELFPPGEVIEPHYYPTMAMSLQFHAKLPLPSNYLASTNTGSFSFFFLVDFSY